MGLFHCLIIFSFPALLSCGSLILVKINDKFDINFLIMIRDCPYILGLETYNVLNFVKYNKFDLKTFHRVS
uniref:YGL028 protein n=1 Tax=Saccharomyces cerevisiae TaxID=4932 RepID=E9P9Y0_YEASX|nr:Unknown [Saccharomyces cerevisiae]